MADVSKFIIHERSNVERLNLLVAVTKIGKKLKKMSNKIYKKKIWIFFNLKG